MSRTNLLYPCMYYQECSFFNSLNVFFDNGGCVLSEKLCKIDSLSTYPQKKKCNSSKAHITT